MTGKADKIYASPLKEIVDFQFDEQVAEVFPDMLKRSVPGYAMMISTIGVLAGRFAQANSRCYDLGCSLGAASLAIRQNIRESGCEIVAVDNSQAMLDRARELFSADDGATVPVRTVCADLQDVDIDNASMVVLNLTLQFIPLDQRLPLLERIYRGLLPGGVLVLSEKIAFDDPDRQQFHTELYQDFKRARGYSELEISQKRMALEKVLIAETLACHQQRLKQAGFGFTETWLQCLNFASLVAVK